MLRKDWRQLRIGLGRQFSIGFAVLAVLLVGVVAGFYYHSIASLVFRAYAEKAALATELSARQVDGDDVRASLAEGRLADAIAVKDEEFKHLKSAFHLQYLYIFVPEPEQIVYVYDAHNEGEALYFGVTLGETDHYMQDRAAIARVLQTGKTQRSLDISTSEYGDLATVFSPVFNGAGEVTAIFAAAYRMNALEAEIRQDIGQALLTVSAMMVLCLFVYLRLIRRRMVRPLLALTGNMRDFVGRAEADLPPAAAIEVPDNNEIRDLSDACSTMAEDLHTYVKNLQEVTAAKQTIEAELNVARNIQRMLLPHIFPPFSVEDQFALCAMIEPAKSVGGDFYDFYMIDDDHLCLTMADVSGKGIPAALFAVIAKTMIKNHALLRLTPAELMSRTNRQLCDGNEENMFVTAFFGILEISTRRLTYVNAGHTPPIIVCTNGAVEDLPVERNLPLAVAESSCFAAEELVLQEGALLFLYTDGVTEAMNDRYEQYTQQRLKKCLGLADAQADLPDILNAVQLSVEEHVADAEQSDDMAMMVLKLLPKRDR